MNEYERIFEWVEHRISTNTNINEYLKRIWTNSSAPTNIWTNINEYSNELNTEYCRKYSEIFGYSNIYSSMQWNLSNLINFFNICFPAISKCIYDQYNVIKQMLVVLLCMVVVFIYLRICLFICLFIYRRIYLFIHLFVYLFDYLFIYSRILVFIDLFIY